MDATSLPEMRLKAGPQAQKSERMRAAILETAVRRLAKSGYHATSIKKIAADGRFSIGAVQHHFPAKLDLMAAVAERALARAERHAMRLVDAADHTGGNAVGIAELVADTWERQLGTDWYQAMAEVFVAARTDRQLRMRIAPAILGHFNQTEARIAAATKAGRANPDLAAFLLSASRCMMGGFLVQDALAMPIADAARFVARWGRFLEWAMARDDLPAEFATKGSGR
jgi:AcrR family transcriptional regulator